MTLQEASLNLTEEQYRELPELSYSSISTFDREGYKCIPTLFEPFSTPSLLFGSMVDCLVTKPEEFPKQYLIAEIPALSETMQAVAGYLLEEHSSSSLAFITDEDILAAAKVLNVYPTYKDATRVQKIRESCSEYYNLMKKSGDKVVVASSIGDEAVKAADALLNDPLTSQFLRPNEFFGDYDILFQLQFTGVSPDGIPFKGMLDAVKIDHANKRIYPCDIKTTKDVYSFEDSFFKYRYYLQAEMYMYLLKETIKEKCPELAEYQMMPYQFIVIDRNIFKPLIFRWVIQTHVVAPNETAVRKSWRQLLIELKWCLEHQDAQLPSTWYHQLKNSGAIDIRNHQIEIF